MTGDLKLQIAYLLYKTTIAPQNPTPDRLFLHIKQRSPLITQNPIAYFPKSNNDRSPLTTHKTRSPISHNKQRSPPNHPQNPIAYSSKSNSDHPSSPNTRSSISCINQQSPLH
jgi:hypothetical protein